MNHYGEKEAKFTTGGRGPVMSLGLGIQVDAGANVVTFMAEYASFLLNRLELGKDGKTAYERVKGKSATVLGIEFGEKTVVEEKGSVQDGQDQLEMGVRDLRWSASPEWRVLGGHGGGRQQGKVRDAYSRGRSVVGRLRELGEACALAFVQRSP